MHILDVSSLQACQANTTHFGKMSRKKQFLKLNIDKFDLIVDLQTKLRNTLILKKVPTKNFYSGTYKFSFCTVKGGYTTTKNICEMTLTNLEKFLNTKINRINYNITSINEEFFKDKIKPNNLKNVYNDDKDLNNKLYI